MNTQYLCIAALLFPAGLLLFSGAVFNSDWLFKMRRAQLWLRLLGRRGSQIVFGVLGGSAMFMGMVFAASGLLNIQVQDIGSPPPGQFFSGGVQYQNATVYLMPPPTGYVPQGQRYSRVTSTYQEFANGSPNIMWNGVNENAKSSNGDILELIRAAPDFSSGWVIVLEIRTGTNPGARVQYEFFDVRSATDWTIAPLRPPVTVNLG